MFLHDSPLEALDLNARTFQWIMYGTDLRLLYVIFTEPEPPPDATGKFIYEEQCRKRGLYSPANQYTCTRCQTFHYFLSVGITPASSLLNNLGEGSLRMRHYYLGGTGTKPLAQALKVRDDPLLLPETQSNIFIIALEKYSLWGDWPKWQLCWWGWSQCSGRNAEREYVCGQFGEYLKCLKPTCMGMHFVMWICFKSWLQNVSNNFMRSIGAHAFAEMLEANTTLKTLSLQGKFHCHLVHCHISPSTHLLSFR